MADEPTHDAELAAITTGLRAAGLLTVGTDAEGRETWTPTPQGAQVPTQLAMSGKNDAEALLDASSQPR